MNRTLALLAACGLGCASWPLGVPRVPACPGERIEVASLPGGDFRLRERARVEGPRVEASFDLSIERRGDRLVVVVFDPFGARVAHAVQEGDRLETESRLGRALAIDPDTLLADVHVALAEHPEDERAVVQRPGCRHTTTFSRTERRPL